MSSWFVLIDENAEVDFVTVFIAAVDVVVVIDSNIHIQLMLLVFLLLTSSFSS